MTSKIQLNENNFGVTLKEHQTSKQPLNTTLCSQLKVAVYEEEIIYEGG